MDRYINERTSHNGLSVGVLVFCGKGLKKSGGLKGRVGWINEICVSLILKYPRDAKERDRDREIQRGRERERTVIFETGMSSGCENKRGILGSRMVKSYGWSQISSGNFPNRPKPCEHRMRKKR